MQASSTQSLVKLNKELNQQLHKRGDGGSLTQRITADKQQYQQAAQLTEAPKLLVLDTTRLRSKAGTSLGGPTYQEKDLKAAALKASAPRAGNASRVSNLSKGSVQH